MTDVVVAELPLCVANTIPRVVAQYKPFESSGGGLSWNANRRAADGLQGWGAGKQNKCRC